jgi:hypothetical protein
MKVKLNEKIGYMVTALLLLSFAALNAQSRGLTVIANDGATLTSFSNSYALVIGESAYNNGWSRLRGVRDDVRAISRLLNEQGFTVTVIEDAPSGDLKRGIENFLDQHGYDENNRLLLYYAGHGHTLKLGGTRDMGYIVPIDAPDPGRDETGFKRLAIDMQQFDSWARKYDSRHILFIFDSCFSGTVFESSRAAPPIIDAKIAQPVRQFITSGDANETVPDRSIFRVQLEAALRDREADRDHDGYVTGSELGLFLESTVTNYSSGTQNPKSGKIRAQGLDRGDFVFAVGISERRQIVVPQASQQNIEAGAVLQATGSLKVNTVSPGRLSITVGNTTQDFGELPEYASLPIQKITAGSHQAVMLYEDGYTEKLTVVIKPNEDNTAEFDYIIRSPLFPEASTASDDWKNKWLYVGAHAGSGLSGGVSGGGLLEVQLLRFLALKLDVGVFGVTTAARADEDFDGYTDTQDLLVSLCPALTFRPGIFEIGLYGGVSYYSFMNNLAYTVGGTFGFRIGSGVIFLDVQGGSTFGASSDTAGGNLSFGAGFKIGLIDK